MFRLKGVTFYADATSTSTSNANYISEAVSR